MSNFVLAAVIIFGGWWILRKLADSQPAQVRKMSRQVMGWAIMAVGGFLLLRGQQTLALSLMALGAGLVGESALFPKGAPWQSQQPSGAPPPRGAMSSAEAYAVLGLKPGASADDVRAAHRRLMKDFHPDKGGSDYLAVKINQAKDLLLQELGSTT